MRSLNDPQTILAALAFIVVTLSVVALALVVSWVRDWRARRKIRGRLASEGLGSVGDTDAETLFRPTEEKPGLMKVLFHRLPHAADIEHQIEQADLGWGVERFAALTVILSMGFGFVAFALVRNPLAVLAASAFGATLPYLYVGRKRRQRASDFERHFPDAIDLLGRAIRAGHAFSTGLRMAADEMPQPVAGEFRRVFDEQRYGLPPDEALMGLADRVDSMDVKIFVTAVLVQREVGGNLAEILDNLADTIRDRFRIVRQVRVHTAQGRMTGYLLAFLPVAMLFILYGMNPDYISILFVNPLGRFLLVTAAVLQVIGFFVIRRIIDIEV